MLDNIINKIHCSDNVKFCKENIPNDSIDLIITSPPYGQLRDYKGYGWNFYELAHEIYRILKPGGVLVWIVNDQTVNGSQTMDSIRQMLYFVDEVGFMMNQVMWYGKIAPQPVPKTHKKYMSSLEYMPVMCKEIGPKTFNPIMVKSKWGGLVGTSGFRQKNGEVRPTDILTINDEKVKENIWYLDEELSTPEIWYYNTGFNQTTKDKFAFEHPAMFPEQLARDHIMCWTNPGDIVFDPFNGAGTTSKVAMMLERNYIGTDLSEDYCNIARKRIELYSTPLFKNENDDNNNLEMDLFNETENN